MMYKIGNYNNQFFPKNIYELTKKFENENNNFKIDSIKSLTNYFSKLKKKIFKIKNIFSKIIQYFVTFVKYLTKYYRLNR